ncbi:MAG TPA: 6-phosphogluconolactonase [Steroidobacteraceae bacterium]|nr:6-phosphogluconolactonase [Steroidobacteraceae bacterium]
MPTPESQSGPSVQPRCFADPAALTAALTERLERAFTAASEQGPTVVMLSGGNTPLPAYRAVAQRGVRPAASLVLCYSDDRYVPSTSEGSNYHQTQPLLDALALPAARVLRVRTELPLEQAAADYDQRLADLARRRAHVGLGLLGLGADGHTASLFTAEHIARAQGRRAISVHRPDGRDAVSVTPEVLTWVTQLVFVVAGADKRTALAALLARSPALTAWQAVLGCRAIEVWTEPAAWPEG